jgi:catechol 2,3-dioxygenase-like lactoylglutathione lyase family enzyme
LPEREAAISLESPAPAVIIGRRRVEGSEAMDRQHVESLVPLAYVADVAAARAFYQSLGFEVCGSFTPPGDDAPSWVSLRCGGAALMLSRASDPVDAGEQAVLFYVYCRDVEAMHRRLAADGLDPGPIAKPFYNPEGEFRLVDPDGYVVMVAHL